MIEQNLTAEMLREWVDYDTVTGLLTAAKDRGRAKRGRVLGGMNGNGYLLIGLFSSVYRAHRLAWLHAYGQWPTRFIDHINGDKCDNRLCNLRDVSQRTNNQNIRKARNGLGLLGVYRRPSGNYAAALHFDGRSRHLGTHETAEAAHVAYLLAKRRLHEGNCL